MTSAILIILFTFAFVSRFWMPEPGVSATGTWFVACHAFAFTLLGAALPMRDDQRWLAGLGFAALLILELAMFPYSTGGVGR